MRQNFVLLSLVILFGAIGAASSAIAISVSLDPTVNLGDGDGQVPLPQISASGDNTVLIWRDDVKILVSSDTNSDSVFSTFQVGDAGNSNTAGRPQVATSGDDAFAIWSENVGGASDIIFRKSTDAGISFAAEIQLSDLDLISSESPQIKINDSNKVYAIWHDKISSSNGNIVFKNGGNNADDVGTASNIQVGTTDRSNPRPQITTQGNDIYVVWQTNSNIKLATSTNDGTSFDSINVGSTGSASDSLPQIASNENAIFVVWKDGINIQLAKISGDGQTIIQTNTIGDTSDFTCPPENSADLATSGTEVYAVWCDDDVGNGDVMFYRSLDGASTYTITNLSDNTGLSTKPKISVKGDNVLVAWSDSTPNDSNRDILIATSADKGLSFNSSNLSQNNGLSTNPQVALSANRVLSVWQDDPTLSGINWDILFRSGELTGSSISFDKNQYRETGNAKITLTGGIGSNPIPATVTSNSNPSGIVIELDPILGSPGTFEGFVSFDPNSSSQGVLLVAESDTITVTAESTTGTASIFPRTINVLSKISGSIITKPLDFGLDASVKVTDQNSNNDPNVAELIIVDVSTARGNPSGVSLTLKETGLDTGVFGGHDGPTGTTLIFSTSPDPLQNIPFEITINQTDNRPTSESGASNKDPNKIDTILVDATSESDPIGIQVDLTETGVNSGIFVGTLKSANHSVNSTNILLIAPGDIVSIENSNALDMRILASPHPLGKNAITALNQATSADTATLSYKGASSQIQVCDCIGQGGGGGGLVRPSLVVNALAGLGGGGSAYSSPTMQLSNLVRLGQIDVPFEIEEMILNYDSSIPVPAMNLGLFDGFDYPLTINNQGFVLVDFSSTLETQKLKINAPHTIKFVFYESDKIQHFSLYTNLRDENTAIHQSDTQILYNDEQEIKVVDPNGFFKDVSFTLNEIGDLKKEIVLEITFAKQMDTTDFIVRSWDPLLNSFDTHILDAIEVVPEIAEESPIITYEAPIIEELESQSIPVWIKNNAGWWSDKQIGDSDFVSGIEYLIKNKIINVPGVEVSASSGSTEIPDWIKNNAGWWAESLITDNDFIEAMQWLIGNGVIQI